VQSKDSSASAARKDKHVESTTPETVDTSTEPKRRRLWFLLGGLALLGYFLFALVAPGFQKYRDIASGRSANRAVDAPVDKKKIALTELSVHVNSFQREMANMPTTAYENLPSLAQRMQTTIDATEAVGVPACLSRVKNLITQSMVVGQAAVRLNHARGNGVNDPGVVTQVHAANRLVNEAREEISKIAC